jgi:glucose-1-phosphate adenylyltransferase
MDYAKMLKFHKEKDAECTIAVLDVPIEEASRFGIMNTNDDCSVYEFEEKPKKPKSTKASMGVYLFNWDILRKYLIDDEHTEGSSNDFGKDVIPKLLSDKKKLFAYAFDGYWKDVGTIQSLWEANMDLIDADVPIELKDPEFKIYGRNYAHPSSFVSKDAKICDSLISEGSSIEGDVIHSVISTGCTIEKGACVENSFVMPNTTIKAGAKVVYSIISENCTIGANAKIGVCPKDAKAAKKDICVIAKDIVIGDGEVVTK